MIRTGSIPLAVCVVLTSPLHAQDPGVSNANTPLATQISRCWNVGSLSDDALGVSVTLSVAMTLDGIPDTESIRMIGFEDGTDAAAREAFETARRAVIRCGASGYDLPEESYDHWRELEITFNPEEMRLR